MTPASGGPDFWSLSAAAAAGAGERRALERALAAAQPGARELAALLSPAADPLLEPLAQRARALTRRHFGRTIGLYAPLYLSNYCSGGCAYCGFAADRRQPRRRLEADEAQAEMAALRGIGIEDVLLLTGERCPEADFEYLLRNVAAAAAVFPRVTVESFAMTTDEYRALAAAGCTGITLYQETYDPGRYEALHRWGPKRDYAWRLEAPARAAEAGMRSVGLGALLGLADPLREAVCLFLHAEHLRRAAWRTGVQLSFPRIRPQRGDFTPGADVDERFLARLICAFRIVLPDAALVLSTREGARFRDGMAGVGINRMSAASRTTVGGYGNAKPGSGGQFEVSDTRSVPDLCAALRAKGLEPVFKDWDAVFQEAEVRGQRSGVRGQESEVREQRTAGQKKR